ncbi:MAG: glutathione S-transferase family protein [Pseudomonadota bacterium]
MTDFILYGTPLSPFVRKAEGALHMAGADYELVNINIMDMPDWFVEISPARRIPVLRDTSIGTDGIPGTIPDSSAICMFLEKRFNAGLYGADAFETGRVAWFEEYMDSGFATTLGLGLFRPLVFPLFKGEASDVKTAKKAWHEKLPKYFDYLEASLDGKNYYIGNKISMADISVAAQMTQLDLVAGLPDAGKWPSLVKHTEMMKTAPGFSENLAKCTAMFSKVMPLKVDLN